MTNSNANSNASANNSKLTPLLFISHGAPTFALEPGLMGPQLQAIGQQLSGIQAVLIVSPHWQTSQVKVMTTAQPETIHDFGGFPPKLYTLQYPAKGHPELARQAAQLLNKAGIITSLDDKRGLDHGAWVPMMHLLPQVNVPVFQVSIPYDWSPAKAFAMGQALAPLREQGVLIVASGSITHNLYDIQPPNSPIVAYANEFNQWVKTAVLAHSVPAMLKYRAEAPFAERAHPTDEHFLPIMVAMGAAAPTEQAQYLNGGMSYGVLSMDAYGWGLPTSIQ